MEPTIRGRVPLIDTAASLGAIDEPTPMPVAQIRREWAHRVQSASAERQCRAPVQSEQSAAALERAGRQQGQCRALERAERQCGAPVQSEQTGERSAGDSRHGHALMSSHRPMVGLMGIEHGQQSVALA